MGVTSISDIVNTINYLMGWKKYQSSKPRGVKMKKTATNRGRSLCEELELILRYKESLINDTDFDIDPKNDTRYFYDNEIILISTD